MSRRQRRGPLRKIVALLRASDDVFSSDLVELECGHQTRSNGIYSARCAKCAAAATPRPAWGCAVSGSPLRVLVCGGRDYNDRDFVWRALDAVLAESEPTTLGDRYCTVIHGACPTGADAHAEAWARVHGMGIDRFHADWATHGRAAGPLRNARMVAEGAADLCIAFLGGAGTRDCVVKARAAGIEVREVAS